MPVPSWTLLNQGPWLLLVRRNQNICFVFTLHGAYISSIYVALIKERKGKETGLHSSSFYFTSFLFPSFAH